MGSSTSVRWAAQSDAALVTQEPCARSTGRARGTASFSFALAGRARAVRSWRRCVELTFVLGVSGGAGGDHDTSLRLVKHGKVVRDASVSQELS